MEERYGKHKYRKLVAEAFKIRINYGDFKDVSKKYAQIKKKGKKKLILCALPGRSGTRWLGDIFEAHPGHIGYVERYTDEEAFYRYVNFNKLPIDTAGIEELLMKGVIKDWEKYDTVFLCSPYFSHGFIHLAERLLADKLIFAVSDPKFTVISMYNKGLFKEEYIKEDPNKATGYQPMFRNRWNHIWGRLTPVGKDYLRWEKMSQIGRCSWYWNTLCMNIYQEMKASKYKADDIFIFKLEEADQNYEYYLKLARWFKLSPIISEEKFLSLKGKTVKKKDNTPKKFTKKENEEFQREVAPFMKIYPKLKTKGFK